MSIKVTVTVEVDHGPDSAYFKHTRSGEGDNPAFYEQEFLKALARLRDNVAEVIVRQYGRAPVARAVES